VKKIISLGLLFTFLLGVITGIVLYIMPHGRIAYWNDWRLLGLNKDQWEALHIVFTFLMVFLGIFHLFINWKIFKKYIFTKQFICILGITVILAFLAIKNLPPVSYVIKLEESIKTSWEKKELQPPIPHAELLSLKTLANRMGIPLELALKKLKSHGFNVPSANTTLKKLAQINHTTPAELYKIISSETQSVIPISYPGRKTLKEVCNILKIDQKKCKEVLKNHGIEPNWDETLKEIASSYGIKPKEIILWLIESRK